VYRSFSSCHIERLAWTLLEKLRMFCHSLSYQRWATLPGGWGLPKASGKEIKPAAKKESFMKVFTAVLASALFITPAVMFAQTPTPGANDYNINQRKVAQQDRIAQGVRSGQLTAGETSHLEHQEAAINHEERAMRAQDNGHLTKQDRSVIHAQQNQESRRIYRDKHNAAVR
jgi:hypothetical protein